MRTVPVEMPPSQAMAYERTVRRALAAKGTDQRARMLQLLRTLDAVCLHPVLPEDAGSDPQYFEHSARFIALFRILDELRAKSDRAVILCDNHRSASSSCPKRNSSPLSPFARCRDHRSAGADR